VIEKKMAANMLILNSGRPQFAAVSELETVLRTINLPVA